MSIEKISSTTPPTSLPPSTLLSSVSGVAGKVARAVAIILITVVGNVLTFGIPLICRVVSHFRMKERKEEIETRQAEHLYTALTMGLEGNEKWKMNSTSNSLQWTRISLLNEIGNKVSGEEAEYFVDRVLALRDAIYNLKTVSVGTVEKVLMQFQTYAKSSKFVEISQKLEDTAPANFLKALAVKFHSADVEDILFKHAKEELGDVEEGNHSIEKIGEVMKDHQKKSGFRKDRLHSIFWAITHPFDFYHSWESQARPDLYNSRKSNPTYTVYSAEMDGKLVRFVAGPSPFNDPVYRHFFLKEGQELRFNLMDMTKRHEVSMIRKMDEMAKRSDGHLEHVLFGFAAKGKQGYLKSEKLDPLVNEYQKALLESRTLSEKGVMIPPTLGDDEIREACEKTKMLMKNLDPDLTDSKNRHAVLVVVDTLIAMKFLKNYLERHKETPGSDIDPDMRAVYVATACKQCFDRGPVYLSTLLLFLKLSSSDALTEEDFYRIAGLPLLRAPLNAGREQLRDKSAIFQALIEILGKNPGALKNALRKH